MRLTVVVAALAALAEAAEGDSCALTFRQPKKARYLKFCQDYNAQACCIPGHDLENQAQFENLIDGLGPGCKNPMMYPELRYFYCLGCDPDQPKYTNNVTMEVKVCHKFVKTLWDDPAYDDCGVMYPNPCPENWQNDGMDPYACGDDLLMPKVQESWEGVGLEGAPSGIAFMNVFKPPGMDDYTFVQAAEGDPDCWMAPAFKPNSASRLASTTGLVVMFLGMALHRLL
mmetsp:Transcript_3762/g.8182  ORF Transcript_3762/g.8182 Transcript_3762/m.8182 type:complete len:228 (-) Transcript_3762:713-1396(-)